MSRRKQKFPSHIAGEGDAAECQEVPQNTLTAQAGEVRSAEEQEEVENSAQHVSSDSTPTSSPASNDSELVASVTSATLLRCCPDPMTSVIPAVAHRNDIGNGVDCLDNGLLNPVREGDGGLQEQEAQDSEAVLFTPKPEGYPASSAYMDIQPLKLVKMGNISELSSVATDRLREPQISTQSSEILSGCPTVPSTKTVSIVSSVRNGGIQESFSPVENSHSPILYSSANGTHNAKLSSAKKSFLISSSSFVNTSETVQPLSYTIANEVRPITVTDNVPLSSNGLIFSDPKTFNSAPKDLHSNTSENSKQFSENESRNKLSKSDCSAFTCPVCQQIFKSKRSFNSHILVHCQLVKSPTPSSKRGPSDTNYESPAKKVSFENNVTEQSEVNSSYANSDKEDAREPSLPLDLSCKKTEQITVEHSNSSFSLSTSCKGGGCPSSKSSSLSSIRDTCTPPDFYLDPGQAADPNHYLLSDRSPLEDENENLVNEAREREKAFFDSAQNEPFLTDDSTGLEPPPPLPMVKSGAITRRIKVCSDEGPPMVYRVKFHAEQIFVSRILGINEETGDKIELYKCFLCSYAFPSVSRLQAHLCHHKQRFVCRKCKFSCDSRINFSQHVQKEHVTKDCSRETSSHLQGDHSDDTSNAENTVTVAALLSALHGSSLDRKDLIGEEPEGGNGTRSVQEEEDERRSEESFPPSPSSEPHLEIGDITDLGGNGGDIFKMFSCRFCGKKFDRAFSCNRHERVHTGYKPCFCRICGRGFSEPRNLRHHVIRFHSDGSLRHLIKRDRRKKKEDDPPTSSEPPPQEVLRECSNEEVSKPLLENFLVSSRPDYTSTTCSTTFVMTNSVVKNSRSAFALQEQTNTSRSESLNTYTTNLTKIFAATLDNSSRNRNPEPVTLVGHTNEPKHLIATIHEKGSLHMAVAADFESGEPMDQLEPGEIRLNMNTKIIEDGERGRRLVVADDQSEEGLDHSPQFSSYAPRLNIVQEPVKRDKALVPITDDIGRTFYECPYCLKFFGSTSDLNRHLDFHEDLRPYECKYCEYSARTNSQLKVHKMRHEGIKQFSCDVCNYNGVTQSDLNRHKKTQSHIARSQNVCTMCGLGFYSGSQKQVHIAKCHPEMEGASSLIQMSLGIPPSQDPNGFSGPNMAASPTGNLSTLTETIVESSPSVNPSLNGFHPKGIFLTQIPNEPLSSPPRQPHTSSSDIGALQIDLSEG